jgi:hypothetical protein
MAGSVGRILQALLIPVTAVGLEVRIRQQFGPGFKAMRSVVW